MEPVKTSKTTSGCGFISLFLNRQRKGCDIPVVLLDFSFAVPVLCSLVGLLIPNALQMCPERTCLHVQYMYTHVYRHICCTPSDAGCNIKGNHMRKERTSQRAEGGLEQIEGVLKEIGRALEGGRGGLSWDNI